MARIDGSSPNRSPVSTDTASVKTSTRQSGRTSTLRVAALPSPRRTRAVLPHSAASRPPMPPRSARSRLSVSSCRIRRPRLGADRQPHGHLAVAMGPPGEQQAGEVRAGHRQYQTDHCEEDEQRRPHAGAHAGEAVRPRQERDLGRADTLAVVVAGRVLGVLPEVLLRDDIERRRGCRSVVLRRPQHDRQPGQLALRHPGLVSVAVRVAHVAGIPQRRLHQDRRPQVRTYAIRSWYRRMPGRSRPRS